MKIDIFNHFMPKLRLRALVESLSQHGHSAVYTQLAYVPRCPLPATSSFVSRGTRSPAFQSTQWTHYTAAPLTVGPAT
jgi:hypothetical protein